MSRVRVASFSVSLDGYGAGPGQSLEHPLGRGGEQLHEWFLPTRTFQRDARQRRRHDRRRRRASRRAASPASAPGSSAATCSARCAARGPTTRGKAGGATSPPYHVPVFVLTHHARAPLEMEGGTTFHFVTDGIEAALARAREAAGGQRRAHRRRRRDVRQYLQAGLVDEMHLALAPALLGSGEALLAGIDLRALGFECTRHVTTEKALHVVLTRR